MGILTVLGLLKKVPKLVKAIKGGNGGLASKAIDIAKAVTGAEDENSSVEALNADPELLYQYEMALLANEHIPDRLDLENTKNARSIYEHTQKQADKIADRVMTWNPWFIFILIITNIIVIKIIPDKALVAVASNLIGMAMKHFQTELQNVINFYFGSSMGSKSKDNK